MVKVPSANGASLHTGIYAASNPLASMPIIDGKPPEVGSKVLCQTSFDNLAHPAEILQHKTDDSGELLVYVHYLDCDRRLDEWAPLSRISSLPAPTLQKLEKAPSLVPLASGDILTPLAGDQKITRRLKRKFEDILHVPAVDDLTNGDHGHDKEHADKPKVKNIKVVEMGRYEMDAWYYSPYPAPYSECERLYVCEYSLKYFRKKKTLLRHLAKLDKSQRCPPGEEIYRYPPQTSERRGASSASSGTAPISVFEVDGGRAKVFCQNLCLLSKLFLDHKTLYYDVDPFLFYVLTERTPLGCQVVGYFSKEKHTSEDHNLACILTLPCHQRKGYGKFLIALAYELSKREGRTGTPERPLSDLGQVSFRSYWTRVLLGLLKDCKQGQSLTIKELSDASAIRPDDIVQTLQVLGLIRYYKGVHFVWVERRIIDEHRDRLASQKFLDVDPACLTWTPHSPPAPRKPRA